MERRRHDAVEPSAAEAAKKAQKANDEDLDAGLEPKPREPPAEPAQQLHAWVMIRGFKRDMTATAYVEPTTGRVFTSESAPYKGVEAVDDDRRLRRQARRAPGRQQSHTQCTAHAAHLPSVHC